MKNPLLFVLVLCFAFTSCKDDGDCTVTSVVGTYMGVDACDASNVHDETITISVGADDNTISYVDDFGTTFETTLEGCNTVTVELDWSGGVSRKEYDLRFSEGEVRLTTRVRTGFISPDPCVRTLTKQ